MTRIEWIGWLLLIFLLPFAVILLLAAMVYLQRWVNPPRQGCCEEVLEPQAGAPVCSQCGYSLLYARERRCPECGEPFYIDEVDPQLAEWDGEVFRPRQPPKEAQ